jgi:hypothetical protein
MLSRVDWQWVFGPNTFSPTIKLDAEKLCRLRGVDLKTDAQRLQAVLVSGDFPLPFSRVEADWIKQAIGAAN